MRIPGVQDNELCRLHWNYGKGRGALGLRHEPSGLTVFRECTPGIPVLQIMRELESELRTKLQNAGLIKGDADPADKETVPDA